MREDFKNFIETYTKHLKDRSALGIPPLPLSDKQTKIICEALLDDKLNEETFILPPSKNTSDTLIYLLDNRVPPGVYPASKVKAKFLGGILKGEKRSPFITKEMALEMLGHMMGGENIQFILYALGEPSLAEKASEILVNTILINNEELETIKEMAKQGSQPARKVLQGWAEARWFSNMPSVPEKIKGIIARTTGEINTDFLSPAPEAHTRDDIPLHALSMLSTSLYDKNFLARLKDLKQKNLPIIFAGDVVGTGSSRKSASNSLVWYIGEDIPFVPNKRRGGIVLASKIAPIFFNTLRGCGAIPIRCSTGKLEEGMIVEIDFNEGKVRGENGEILSEIKVDPPSILDEARAGGRNNLIIGRKLTLRAINICKELNIKVGKPALKVDVNPPDRKGQPFTLAQKLVGNAAGLSGVLPGDYVEPAAHLVFSQDTTGKMTQQEIMELATTKFATTMIQSFCHTPAGPKSKDSAMQTELGKFIAELGGIDLRPGDGIIHTNGNRFLLPYFVGTGGDSHTRFPIGISFPAGSDLVAFAASQGYFPLDMPESVLVRFKGKPKPWITTRDLVHAIPYVALKTGKLNLEKGDAKVNVFADRILEIEGLEFLNVVESFQLTDASAERSAAAATITHTKDAIIDYVRNNLNYLEKILAKRHPSPRVNFVINQFKEWLANPVFFKADPKAKYADIIEIDLDKIDEPLMAAPNDPDKTVTLSEVAGTKIDEVFIGSCMVDITAFRAAEAILRGQTVRHSIKLWTVPPDRESFAQLASEGIVASLLASGANFHIPGCSLCMGNQAQVATNAMTFSTSTRNFDNRMGMGAQVFLGSAHLAAMIALLGYIPTIKEYKEIFAEKILPEAKRINKQLEF